MVVISSQIEENTVTSRYICELPSYYLNIGTTEKWGISGNDVIDADLLLANGTM